MPISSTVTTVMQDAAGATGDGLPLDLAGRSAAAFQVLGTFSATITWEATIDGTNWIGVALASLNSTTRARALTATAPGLHVLDDATGVSQVRARISGWVSGAVTVVGAAAR